MLWLTPSDISAGFGSRRSWKLGVSATHVDQVHAVRRPRYLIHLLTVIFVIRGQSSGDVFAGAIASRDPEIPLALLVFYPGHATRLRACGEIGSKRCAERLFERKVLAFCREPETTVTANAHKAITRVIISTSH